MNLIKKSVESWVAVMIVATFGAAAVSAADGDPDAKQEVRDAAAIKLLKERKDVTLMYVKGLVCPSCAIGIRVKVGKLPFVDSTRYKRGLDMDTKTQLLTVALLPGFQADVASLDKAVNDAGYDPVEWYSLEAGKLKTHPFASAKKLK